MEPGDLIDLDVTDVAHGGVFVSRYVSHDTPAGPGTERPGRVVFVADAIPGERVRVRLTDLGHSAFWRGETVEVLEASPHRRPHVWPAADVAHPPELRPGGADLGHIDLEHQRILKHQVVSDALRRIGGIDVPVSIAPVRGDEPDGTRWRTRVSLHVDGDGRIGPYAARSHHVVEVVDLPLATAAVADAARAVTGAAPGRVDLVQPEDGRVRVIPRPATGHHGRHSRSGGSRRPRSADAARTRLAEAAVEVVVERVDGREFLVDAGGFWQVHRGAAHTLHGVVAAALADRVDPDAEHLDLYGGVGLFAATLADAQAVRVTSVESDARATSHARENLSDHPGVRAETGRVDRYLERLRAEASAARRGRFSRGVVLLDPPRSGAGREVVASIIDLSPATVVYVACDPVALARDLATFRASGYETPRIDAFDLFPHSHHVEAVAVLSR